MGDERPCGPRPATRPGRCLLVVGDRLRVLQSCRRLGTAQSATEDDVESASQFFVHLGLGQSVVHAAPGARPNELVGWLNARGYVAGARWLKLWHDLQEIGTPNPTLRIERIGASQAETWGDLVIAAFELPEPVRPIATATIDRAGWIHYLGFEGDTPVSTAAMRLGDDVAWLGYGGTLDAFRGRGWQTAMFLQRLVDARDRGCRLAITETGEETEKSPVNHSYRNMLRTGFELAYARQNWVRVPTQPGQGRRVACRTMPSRSRSPAGTMR